MFMMMISNIEICCSVSFNLFSTWLSSGTRSGKIGTFDKNCIFWSIQHLPINELLNRKLLFQDPRSHCQYRQLHYWVWNTKGKCWNVFYSWFIVCDIIAPQDAKLNISLVRKCSTWQNVSCSIFDETFSVTTLFGSYLPIIDINEEIENLQLNDKISFVKIFSKMNCAKKIRKTERCKRLHIFGKCLGWVGTHRSTMREICLSESLGTCGYSAA